MFAHPSAVMCGYHGDSVWWVWSVVQVELSYRRYKDQLHHESQSQRKRLKGQLQVLRDHMPHTPCSG